VLSEVGEATGRRYRAAVFAVQLYCEQHLHERLELAELAAVAGLSPHYFHRIFHRVTGEAPKEYLRRLRLERAVYRLRDGADSVLQIALDSGFATPETFTRAFRSRFELTPSEFRRVIRAFRAATDDIMTAHTFEGFTDETPLTLRFDLRTERVSVQRTPGRHLLFLRHSGFEHLLAGRDDLLGLWDELMAFADCHDVPYSKEVLVGITHDDPYVTEERRMRFDACLVVAAPVAVRYPFGCRELAPGLSVVRCHSGGLEEVARTYASIGVDWMPTGAYGLAAAPPYEVHHCELAPTGGLRRVRTEAHVPLVSHHTRSGEAGR